MFKGKVKITQRILHWFTYHPLLKIIALALAVILWLYAKGEIVRFNY